MAERPIIFSGPMVRAILEGRKTQTRRAVRKQPVPHGDAEPGDIVFYGNKLCSVRESRGRNKRAIGHLNAHDLECPYGAPGDTLWVRETFAVPPGSTSPDECAYRADNHHSDEATWTPSIYMPRWASRLTLRVTDVRVQRLHEVTEEDALAEGVEAPRCPNCGYTRVDCGVHLDHHLCGPTEPPSATFEFEYLWESINGKRAPWSSNPWVWAVTFEREKEQK